MKSKTKNFFNRFFSSLKVNFYKFLRNLHFDSRTRGGRIFKSIFFFFLYAIATIGIVFGLINLGENNTNQGLFGKTYNATYKLDIPTTATESEAKKLTENAVERFTNYLLYRNVITNNITYSVKQSNKSNENNKYYDGYIYVSYTNVPIYYDDEFKNSETEGNFDIDPNKYALDNQSSNTITAWYFNPAANLIEEKYSYNKLKSGAQIFKSTDFDYASARIDDRKIGEGPEDLNNYGTTFNLNNSSYEYLNDAGLDPSNPNSFKSQYDASTNALADTDLQWIVFKNIDHLVNLLNYAKYVVFNYEYYSNSKADSFSGSTQTKWKIYYDNLNSVNSTLVSWAKNAINYNESQVRIGINSITSEYLIQCYEYALGHDDVTKNTIPTIVNDGNSNLLTIMKDYVIGVVSKLNYKQWFPNVTSWSSNISGASVNSFAIQPWAYESTKYTTAAGEESTTTSNNERELRRDIDLKLFQNSSLPIQFYSIPYFVPAQYQSTNYENLNYSIGDLQQIYLNYEEPTANNPNDSNAINNEGNNYLQSETRSTTNYFGTNGWISNPFIETSVVSTLSTYNSVFLASGVIILLIAVVVSVLYRIPGMLSAFSIIAAFGFSLSLLIVLKIDISIPSLLGLFVGTMVSVMSISMVMERIRRLLLQKNSVFDSIQTAIKKSMLSTVDLNVTIMVIGLTMFFIAKGELTNMGMTLLLSGLLSLGSTFVFFIFPLYSYSTFKFSWNARINLLHLSKLRNKISFNSNKWWIIWGVLIGIILIAGIVFGTAGLTNSVYKDGTFTTITILGNTNSSVVDSQKVINSIQNTLGNDWSLTFKNISEYQSADTSQSLEPYGYYYLIIQGYSKNSVSLSSIQNQLRSVIETNYSSLGLSDAILNNISIFQVSKSLITDIFLSGIYSLLAGWGFLCVYYSIRLNVLSIIPVFIAGATSSMVTVSLSYLFQFEINLLFVYVLATSGILSILFSCLYVSVTKTRFVKNRIFEQEKIHAFILNNIKSLLNVIHVTIVSNIIIFALLAGLVSPSTTLFFINTMIANIIAIPIGYFLIAHLYYYVILIRQKYVQRIISNLDTRLSKEYKEVDEQLIMGINKFH
ncbi:MAG: hypothetical protein K2I76_00950 [Malacoplasma sp.]|nr:hypothetical protein [Malacoplasma sp.]MDE6082810.1 hypothetical protein [Malacoplasma sp.]